MAKSSSLVPDRADNLKEQTPIDSAQLRCPP